MEKYKIKGKIEIKPFDLSEKNLTTLLKFDDDNQKINFPKDKQNIEATVERIKKEYREEPEGMNFVIYDGKIIGCLFLKTRYNPYRRCYYGDLRNIYLTEKFRGKGIGKYLIVYMEKYFKNKGCKYMFLGTSVNNKRARRLFKNMEFIETRVLYERDIKQTLM